jgi:hypothetical protein
MSDFRQLLKILNSKHEHFIFVDFTFYKKWKFLIKIITLLNGNYKSCEIFRKKYKFYNNIVVIGLKWSGKKVKRRTGRFAKGFIEETKNSKCIYCECELNRENATTDHIIPISRGGNNTQINFIVSCSKCNSERGDVEFYQYLKIKNNKYSKYKLIFV